MKKGNYSIIIGTGVLLIGILLFLLIFYVCYAHGSPDAWIGFLGSVIGGGVTLPALYLILRHERKLREEYEALQNKYRRDNQILSIRPCVIGEPVLKRDDGILVPLKDEYYYFRIEWKLLNVTGNVAKNVRFQLNNAATPSNDVSLFFEACPENEFLKPNGERTFYSGLGIIWGTDGLLPRQNYEIKNTLVIEYSDLLGLKDYQTEFSFTLNLFNNSRFDLVISLGEYANREIADVI